MRRFLLLLLMVPLISSCTTIRQVYECVSDNVPEATFTDCMASPSRIQRSNTAAVEEMKKICVDLGGACVDDLKIVGHQASSYRYYPMGVGKKDSMIHGNDWARCSSNAWPVTNLIDQAFNPDSDNKSKRIEADAIEIDLQAAPLDSKICKRDRDCIFVMHNRHSKDEWDRIVTDEAEAEELIENGLRRVLKDYISKRYHENKHLYLELKSIRGCNAPDQEESECTDLAGRVAAMLNEMAVSETWDRSKKWITFTSFSATSLNVMYEKLDDGLKDKFGYALIAGMYPLNPILWCFAQSKGSVPYFNQALQDFAAKKPWLNEIWFSPQGITKYGEMFQKIATKREESCVGCPPLTFSVATYSLKKDEFEKRMIAQASKFNAKGLKITGMMIDIEDSGACKQP